MSNIIHTGRVVDEAGEPLIGAHVLTTRSNPKRGVITDSSGYFTVDGQAGEEFEIGFIGFEPTRFNMKKYMGKPTYRLEEGAFELDGFTGTPTKPYVPQPTKPSNGSLWQIFGGVAETFFDNANVFQPIAPIRTQEIKVPTYSNGVVIPSQPVITTSGQQGKVSVIDVINKNPIATGGILLGVLALGAYVMNKE